ncbi:AMP-binding protein [Pseudonocardia petroleophila]|uniref:AMP-binding protein n=1 Tax=Pseudonocardia petroleophila TaxID=37331 RepID=A0A7G7MJ05_9PSEU|nr:AMP-binding protein [Pseudonocardia petroleophila]QNG52766.1 AMP-binding protein [Pseudonocardia petroleophila]
MDGDRAGTVGEALVLAAARHPDAVALVDGADPARRWTFGELEAESRRAARGLLARFAPGEHVAVWAPNRPEWIVLQFGAALAGLVLVTVNPALRAAEVHDVLERSDAVGVVVEGSYRGTDLVATVESGRARLPALREVWSFARWDELLAGDGGDLPVVDPGSTCQIQYTSGTTGAPKGAMITHRGMARNGALYATTIGAGRDDVWVNAMPLFHTAGCGLATLGAVQTGGAQVLVPGFDADLVLDLLQGQRGTLVLQVPTMLVRLAEAQAARPRDLSTWRLTTLGGAPVAPELVRRAQDELGVAVAIGFGQTESSPYITHTLPDDPHPAWERTVGPPMDGIEVRVTVPGTAEEAAPGEVGEICTRSACVMRGYYRDPDATAAAIDAGGWLHTGDLGRFDEHGYLQVAGRLKDMIIRGGENVYPREVEDVLLEHPAVDEVAVVGAPDPEWGETVAAFVRSERGVTGAELEAFCRARLASFKVPRVWRVVDGFPQTASGKIQKFQLAARLAEGR